LCLVSFVIMGLYHGMGKEVGCNDFMNKG
jgi:hypothetical protein